MTGRSILFVPGANPEASFIALDRGILAGLADLVELAPGSKVVERVAFAVRLRRVLSTNRVGLVVVWFATPGYGSIVAAACRAGGVPYLVVSGGADVARHEAAGFGDARRPWRRFLVARVLAGASVVWAFSDSARAEIEAVAVPRRLRVVPPPVDTAFFVPRDIRRVEQVVTACWTISRLTIRQKGLDRFVDLARRRPRLPFVVVGQVDSRDARVTAFVRAAPANVTFAGFVSRESLRELYGQSRVYLQLSLHEGFGVAVAEAIAMGCTPIVSNQPSLRAIVANPALVVGDEAPLDEVMRTMDQAMAGSYAAERWTEMDRRFGRSVRRAAWIEELTAAGLPIAVSPEP